MKLNILAVAALAIFIAPSAWPQTPASSVPTPQEANGQARSAGAGTSGADCARIQFSGEVTRGQEYVHPLPDDLEFHLFPSRVTVAKTNVWTGWFVFIGQPGNRTENYIAIATPPYHGPNADDIEARHFRNQDNTGPNKGQVNAPTDIRAFSFVLNETQYKKFFGALNLVEHAPDTTEEQRTEADNFLAHGARQHGTLTIVDMKLGGLEKGTLPWFEWMKFNVDLCFPPATVR